MSDLLYPPARHLTAKRIAGSDLLLRDKPCGRIVLVVPQFPKLSESFIVNKFVGLFKRGWDVHIVCETSDRDAWSRFPDLMQLKGAISRIHCVWPHRPRWRALAALPLAMLQCTLSHPSGAWRVLRNTLSLRVLYLNSTIVSLRPDLVHFEFGTLALDRLRPTTSLRCRTVVSFRGYDLNYCGLNDPKYFDDVWHYADAIHVLGTDLWNRALRRGCPASKPHFLISPAIDTRFFSPRKNTSLEQVGSFERPLRILSVGRLEWKKGYEFGLQAIRQLLDRGTCCRYEIIGGGDYLEAIAFATHQLKLTDHVQLLGPLDRRDVRERFDHADVLMHSAVSEGFCNAVLEAQAMQLPVVVTDADGLSENVVDESTGYVVPRRDPSKMAARLATLAADASLRHRMGTAGRRRVVEQFALEQHLDAIESMYHEILQIQ